MSGRSAVTVLHVSDMQFGAKHRFGSDEGTAADRRHATLAARLLDDVRQLPDDLAPDLVIASGDLAEQAKPAEFEEVHDFFAELAEGFGLTRDRVVMVPGNHDINWKKCQAYFLDCEGDGTEPVMPYWPKLEPYSVMFQRFYSGAASFPKDQPWTIFEIAELKTVVAGLNSVMIESHRDENHYGWCGEEQLHAVAARLREHQRDGWLRIGVVHHNPVITSGEDSAYLRDSGRFEEILVPHLNVLMHGHTHEGRICTIGPDGLPVLCAGSAGVRQSARADDVPNQYQIVRITSAGLHIRARRYNPGRSRWEGDTSVGRLPDESHLDIRGRLREADGAFPETVDDTLPRIKAAPVRYPDDLLSRVSKVCQVRNPSAQVEVVELGGPARYLRVTAPGVPQVSQYPIGVIDGTPTHDKVAEFRRVADARYRAGDPNLTSYLVYDGDPAPADVRELAGMQGIRLQSLLEYQGVYDLRPYAHRQAERLADSTIYPSGLYVPQRFTIITGAGRRGGDPAETDALTRLLQLVADHDGRFVVILGDFGHGKTFLLRELTRRIHHDQTPPVVPILIQLRELEKAHSLEQLLAAHLTASGEEVIDHRLLRYLIREGRVLLLFDGFDELALRVTYDRAAEHLDALVRAAEGRAKVILTSRIQHFLSDRQVETALSIRTAGVPGRTLMRLNEFTDTQIMEFLTNLLDGDAAAATARYELIRDIRDLLGLSRNPRMLSFIAMLEPDRLVRIKDRDPSGSISAAALYYELLDRWLGFEYERSQPPGAPPTLSKEQRWATVTGLALRLWDSGEESLGLADLAEISADALGDLADHALTADQASHLIGSGTLLIRTDDNQFRFVHRSVMEWLVANASADHLTGGSSEVKSLAVRTISPLMADFVADLAGRPVTVAWCRGVLAASPAEAGPTAKNNALTLLRRLQEPFQAAEGSALQLDRIDLSGQDLTGADLHGAYLASADLSETRLDGADLTAASLFAAHLSRCSGKNVRLAHANLRNADLSRARLPGCDLRHADLSGARLTRTTLLGARLDDSALDDNQSFGTALSGRPISRVQISSSPGIFRADLSWHPNGEFLVSGGVRGARIWDASTGEPIRDLISPSPTPMVAWSRDGTRIATTSNQGVRIWNASTGETIRNLVGDPSWALAWSPDSTRIVTTSNRMVRIWNATTGETIHHLTSLSSTPAVGWSPDGTRIAATSGRMVRIWNATTGETIHDLPRPSSTIWALAWSPDCAQLAVGSDRVRILDVTTGETIHDLTSPGSSSASALAWSPDGTQIATTSDRETRIWNTTTGETIHDLPRPSSTIWALAWSPDGTQLATISDQETRIWNTTTGETIQDVSPPSISAWALAWSPDGTQLATISDRETRIWNTTTGEPIRDFTMTGWDLAWSPDGTQIATISDQGTRIWSTTGEPVRDLVGSSPPRFVAWKPDSTQLATSDDQGTRIWDTTTGEPIRDLTDLTGSLAWSPDGTQLATTNGDRVRIWDIATGEPIRDVTGIDGPVFALAWSPDGTRLAVGNQIRIVDAATGEPICDLTSLSSIIWALAWSPDGTRIASGTSDRVRVWDTATSDTILDLASGSTRSMAWSPDGTRIAAAGDYGIKVWDAADGTSFGTIIPLADGWAVLSDDGFTYKYAGTPNGEFWWSVGLCPFSPGELDPYYPELKRLPAGTPLTEFAVRPSPPGEKTDGEGEPRRSADGGAASRGATGLGRPSHRRSDPV